MSAGGALTQVVGKGAQDAYLTSNPSVTFFKSVYRRYTNFAMESVEQTWTGDADFSKKVVCTITRTGDLLYKLYLQLQLPALETSYIVDPDTANSQLDQLTYINSVGNMVMETIKLEIGGQEVDKHTGEWLEIWSELTETAEKKDGYGEMIGKQDADIGLKNSATISQLLFVPLRFWFTQSTGLALPLVAIQFHDTKIHVDFRPRMECIIAIRADGDRIRNEPSGNPPGTGYVLTSAGQSAIHFEYCQLWATYVYLDTVERTRFASQPHEYLVDQLQYTSAETIQLTENKVHQTRIPFNHPTKVLIWRAQRETNGSVGGNVARNDWTNFSTADPGEREETPYTGDILDPEMGAIKITLNGKDRFSARSAKYFRLVQPYDSFTRVPSKHIYVYSLAINPEDPQPSGSVNLSRIENVFINIRLSKNSLASPDHATSPYGEVFGTDAYGTFIIYGINHNIFRIVSGMAGMAYAS